MSLRDLTERLEALTGATPGVEAAALVSEEGVVLASALPHDVDPGQAARVGKALADVGTSAMHQLARGDAEEVLVRSAHGWSVVLTATNATAVRLVVLAARHASVALLLLEARKAADDLALLVGEGLVPKEARHGDAVG
ncbi:MAG: roadblock/LC7 domain-containing protein [Polyangiaceae bacterium]